MSSPTLKKRALAVLADPRFSERCRQAVLRHPSRRADEFIHPRTYKVLERFKVYVGPEEQLTLLGQKVLALLQEEEESQLTAREKDLLSLAGHLMLAQTDSPHHDYHLGWAHYHLLRATQGMPQSEADLLVATFKKLK